MQGEPWPFWKGWEGILGPFCLRDHRGSVEGQRGTWWPQNGEGIHTLAGEEEREREREAQCERAGLFGERKTTHLREIALESEEEGHGPPRHPWNV